jgi:hypothetical protein
MHLLTQGLQLGSIGFSILAVLIGVIRVKVSQLLRYIINLFNGSGYTNPDMRVVALFAMSLNQLDILAGRDYFKLRLLLNSLVQKTFRSSSVNNEKSAFCKVFTLSGVN